MTTTMRDPYLDTLVTLGRHLEFYDPDGHRYGIPTYPWKMAPLHLRTLRQLTAEGLRPGGQGVQAQVLWCSRRHGAPGVRAAYLYDVRFALPKRIAGAVWQAARSLEPVEVGFGTGACPIVVNRRASVPPGRVVVGHGSGGTLPAAC